MKKCFCAFCRSERIVYSKRHLSLVDILLTFLCSVLFMLGIWQDFDPRIFIFFAIFLGLAEGFIVLRWRLSMACPHCGFNPIIYIRDKGEAVKTVKDFMAKRSLDPRVALAPRPKVPYLIKKVSETAKPMVARRASPRDSSSQAPSVQNPE